MCKKCNYRWKARIEEPRECPQCKTRYWKEECHDGKTENQIQGS